MRILTGTLLLGTIVAIRCLSDEETQGSRKKLTLLPDSQRSEFIEQGQEMHKWMARMVKRCEDACSRAKAEVDAIIADPSTNTFMNAHRTWFTNRTVGNSHVHISWGVEAKTPQTARKNVYKDSESKILLPGADSYDLDFHPNGRVESYNPRPNIEHLSFYPNGSKKRYGFSLTTNRSYVAQWDDQGKLVRELIAKPHIPQPERPRAYELYFPGTDDLSILKNKLLHEDLCACLVARAEVEKKWINFEKDLSQDRDQTAFSASKRRFMRILDELRKTVRSTRYDMDYDNKGEIARFLRKTTGDEITFHPNGKVKTFRMQLTDSKDFKVEWDSMGKLVKEQEIPR